MGFDITTKWPDWLLWGEGREPGAKEQLFGSQNATEEFKSNTVLRIVFRCFGSHLFDD